MIRIIIQHDIVSAQGVYAAIEHTSRVITTEMYYNIRLPWSAEEGRFK